jgi:transposase
MVPRPGLYDDLIRQHVPTIKFDGDYVTYGNRNLFIKKVAIEITKENIPVNCYICYDKTKFIKDYSSYYNHFDPKISKEQLQYDELKFGIFILVSTINLSPDDLLPTYYNRQYVEKIFDYMKNDVSMLPISTHNERTFSGHILISFMATVCFVAISKALKNKKLNFEDSLRSLKGFCCKTYNDHLPPDTCTKRINDILKSLKIKIPTRIYNKKKIE